MAFAARSLALSISAAAERLLSVVSVYEKMSQITSF
jgi:hypothetical protein